MNGEDIILMDHERPFKRAKNPGGRKRSEVWNETKLNPQHELVCIHCEKKVDSKKNERVIKHLQNCEASNKHYARSILIIFLIVLISQ